MTATAEPRVPFPSATGKGVKIAVIDSGVNIRHPHIVSSSTFGVVLASDEAGASWEDQIGHGTAVMAAIQEKAPEAEYHAVKLFGPSLRSTARRLIEAIEWSIDNRMDLINLSLGTTNLDYKDELQTLVRKALDANSLIVSAHAAGDLPALPGVLEGVIGVDVDWELPRGQYRIKDESGKAVFVASGFPRGLPGLPQSKNLHGISFAVANMTGIIARAVETSQTKSYEGICKVLAAEAPQLHTSNHD
jgi:hypothetical protein